MHNSGSDASDQMLVVSVCGTLLTSENVLLTSVV